VPVNFRTALKDTSLPVGGGSDCKSSIFVSRGTTVAFCPYALHRRPDLYGMDAALFRPERWDGDLPLPFGPTSSKWGYIPFGAGPRMCLGSEYIQFTVLYCLMLTLFVFSVDFALTEAAFTIVRLLQEFQILRLPEGETVELIGTEKQVMTLVMSIGKDCRVSTA
jgi:hypothetical protein